MIQIFVDKKIEKKNDKISYTFCLLRSHRYLNFRTEFFIPQKKQEKLFDPKSQRQKPDLGEKQKKIGSFKLLSLLCAPSNKFHEINLKQFFWSFPNQSKCHENLVTRFKKKLFLFENLETV